MALTKEQKQTVRQAITAGAEKRGNEMRTRMEFEEQRDKLAYELTEKNIEARAKAKADGKQLPDLLAWGDAQALAEAELTKPPKGDKPAKPSTETPAK